MKAVQVLPHDTEKGLGKVTLRVTMQADMPGLLGIFHAIESAVPLLFVDSVTLAGPRLLRQTLRAEDGIRQVAMPIVAEDTVQASFEVYGYHEGLRP